MELSASKVDRRPYSAQREQVSTFIDGDKETYHPDWKDDLSNEERQTDISELRSNIARGDA